MRQHPMCVRGGKIEKERKMGVEKEVSVGSEV